MSNRDLVRTFNTVYKNIDEDFKFLMDDMICLLSSAYNIFKGSEEFISTRLIEPQEIYFTADEERTNIVWEAVY